ncbi:hypothetical protein JCM19236_1025 [Vibrio sp. JCM 19236]|nr:hypothetical protein JCM19236_1025 [Vibrio sp. JCM 19236]
MSNDEKVYQKLLRAIVEHKLEPVYACLRISFLKPLGSVALVFARYFNDWQLSALSL